MQIADANMAANVATLLVLEHWPFLTDLGTI